MERSTRRSLSSGRARHDLPTSLAGKGLEGGPWGLRAVAVPGGPGLQPASRDLPSLDSPRGALPTPLLPNAQHSVALSPSSRRVTWPGQASERAVRGQCWDSWPRPQPRPRAPAVGVSGGMGALPPGQEAPLWLLQGNLTTFLPQRPSQPPLKPRSALPRPTRGGPGLGTVQQSTEASGGQARGHARLRAAAQGAREPLECHGNALHLLPACGWGLKPAGGALTAKGPVPGHSTRETVCSPQPRLADTPTPRRPGSGPRSWNPWPRRAAPSGSAGSGARPSTSGGSRPSLGLPTR